MDQPKKLLSLDDFAPRVLPATWQEADVLAASRAYLRSNGGDVCGYYCPVEGLYAMLATEPRGEQGDWLHLSLSRARDRKLPSWRQLKLAREVLMGDEPCIQLFPPRAHWKSIAEVLHLYRRLDAPTIPPVWEPL